MSQLIKHCIKQIIAYSLYYSGTLALLLKIKLRNKLVVLMYHRVLEADELENSYSNVGIVVRKETFDIHVQYLMTHFKPLSLNQVTEHIEEKLMFNSGHCLITFDDGWIDNYSNAFFLLKKHKAPALIFLPTNYISSQNIFWQENLSCIILSMLKNCKKIPNILVEKGLDKLNHSNPDTLKAGISEYISSLKLLSNKEIDAIIDEFNNYFKLHNLPLPINEVDKYLSWEQVSEMNLNNVRFGSHATSHRLLTKLNKNELDDELKQSKTIISDHVNDSIDSIAYPNGNFNDAILESVQQSGYKIGFTTNEGYFHVDDNPYTIKRVNIHQNSTKNVPLFLCRILGLF